MALVDFTNPAAVRWYQSKLRALLDIGVDCFKTDFGERIPTSVVYHDRSDPHCMHNYYTYLYNKAVFEVLEEFHGSDQALVFARSATVGAQKFPVHWGGDCFASFESMAESLRGGLSFCMSGPAFWAHDIGGFAGKADPALYKRWVAFGLLSTHSRLHGSESYRVPWIFDEESVDVMRPFVKLKNRLYPYLSAMALEAKYRGWPVMRAMPLEFASDPACRHLDRQYMLGGSILVCPVFDPKVAQYYLPAGRWTHLLTGEAAASDGKWVTEDQDFYQMPVFVRENALVPMSDNDSGPDWKLDDPLTLHLYHIAPDADLEVRIAPSNAGAPAVFRCRRKVREISVESDGRARKVRIALHGHLPEETSNARQVKLDASVATIEWADVDSPLIIHCRG
jgi:alpha-D-xyloside xylohydrolase